MPQAKLTREAQEFAVTSLACFDSPSVVSHAIRAEFGISITPQSVECYDPNKRAGRNISERWKAIFNETRKVFLENSAAIGISHRTVRLRALQRMAEKAESMGNLGLAAQLHEQAAKEIGDSFTNRRELTGKGGKDLPAGQVTVFQLPDNDRG